MERKMSDDLINRLRKTTQSGKPRPLSKADRLMAADTIEALQAERDAAVDRAKEASQYLAIETRHAEIAETQLAKSREDGLREAAEAANEADSLELVLHGPAKIVERILALIDTPTPAPSPDACPFGDDCDLTVAYMAGAHDAKALVGAAEMMVKAYREESDQTITAFYALEAALAAIRARGQD
jgi:hypothetical protein